MSAAAIAGLITIAGTILGFLIKWYWGDQQRKAEEAAAQKKAESDAEQAAQDQKKNQETVNDSIAKQMGTADSWEGKP